MSHGNSGAQAKLIQDIQMDQARAPTPLMTGGTPEGILPPANLQQIARQQELAQTALLQSNPYLLSAAMQSQQAPQQYMNTAGLQSQLLSALSRQQLQSGGSLNGGVLAQQLALLSQQPQSFSFGNNGQPSPTFNTQQMQAISLLYSQAALQAVQQQRNSGTQNLNNLATIALMNNQQVEQVLANTPNMECSQKRNSAFGEVVSPNPSINPALLHVAAENLHATAERRQSAPVADRSVRRPLLNNLATVAAAKSSGDMNHEALQEHISRLISENEAILEPSPVLLKRRAYHRHQAVSADHAFSDSPCSSKNAQAKRSHSLQLQSSFDSGGLVAPVLISQSQQLPTPPSNMHAPVPHNQMSHAPLSLAHSVLLPAPQPIKVLSPPQQTVSPFKCHYCLVMFPNEKYLEAHEFRCSRRPSGERLKSAVTVVISAGCSTDPQRSSPVSSPRSGSLGSNPSTLSNSSTPTSAMGQSKRYPLKKRILAAEKDAEAERQAKIARIDEVKNSCKVVMPQPVSSPVPASLPVPVPAPMPSPRVQVTPRQSPAVDVQTISYLTNQRTTTAPSLHPVAARFLFAQAALNSQEMTSQTPLPINNAMVAVAQLQSILAPDMRLCASDQTRIFKPYTLSVTIPGGQSFDAPRTGRRSRHVTAPTFVCLKRPQPCFFQQKDTKLSMYSNWQQIPVSAMEAKLNLIWMGCCSMKGMRGSNGYWRYTNGETGLNALRNTHSSFWATSKKMIEEQQKQLVELGPSLIVPPPRPPAAYTVIDQPTCSAISSPTVTLSPNGSEKSYKAVQDSGTQYEIRVKREEIREEREEIGEEVGREHDAKRKGHPFRRNIWKGKQRYQSDDLNTYVRGLGRGRYVCERCGIKCRKPSMLQKHMRSHSNIRPFTCNLCSISFKTKGNLTKHSKSKAHFKSVAEVGSKKKDVHKMEFDTDEDDKLVIDDTQGNQTDNDTLSEDETRPDLEEALNDEHMFGSDELESGDSDFDEFHGCVDESLRPTSVACSFRQQQQHSGTRRECSSAPPVTGCASVSPHSGRKRLSTAARRRLLEMVGRRVSETSEDLIPTTSSNGVKLNPPKLLLPGRKMVGSCDELSAFLKADEENTKCELCAKEFRKMAELRLHMQVHYYEQSSRRYVYVCPHCRTSFRSKSLLVKHTATAHPGAAQTPDSPHKEGDCKDVKGNNSNAKVPPNQPPSPPLAAVKSSGTNPRPFECVDCGTAFRIHGHLAKHLRSKLHVMKLEMQGKLPIGTFAKIESSNLSLNEVDTSDCDHTLRSLKIIADRLEVGLEDPPSSSFQPILTRSPTMHPSCSPNSQCSPVDVVSLTPNSSNVLPIAPSLICEEQMAPSPTPMEVKQENISPQNGKESGVCVSSVIKCVPSTSSDVPASSANSKFIVADTWVPPTGVEVHIDSEVKPETAVPYAVQTSKTPKVLHLKLEPISGRQQKMPKGSSEESTQTKCSFCQQQFSTPCDLNIHLHTDHIAMRDGTDFKCPRPNCGKLVPNKTSLRQHVSAHFYGLLQNASNGSSESGSSFDGASDGIAKETMHALQRKIHNPFEKANGTHNGSEEKASSSRTKYKTHLVKLNSIPEVNGQDVKPIGMALLDASPVSDSEASRGSSSQSVSPSLTPHSSHATSSGGITAGRPVMKRKYEEQPSPGPLQLPTVPKHRSVITPEMQHARRCSSAVDNHPPSSTPMSSQMPSPLVAPRPTLSVAGLQALQQQRMGNGSMGGPSDTPWTNYPHLFMNGSRQLQGIHPALLAAAYGLNNLNGLQQYNNNQQQQSPHQMYQSSAHQHVQQSTPVHQQPINVQVQASHGHQQPINVHQQASRAQQQPINVHHQTNNVQQPSPMQRHITNGYSPSNNSNERHSLPCALCGRRFGTAMALQEHLLSHVTERPWVCDRCDAGFTNQNALRSHMTSHNTHEDGTGPMKAGHKQLNI